MSFMPNDDAAQFGRHVRGFLTTHASDSARRELIDSGGDYDATDTAAGPEGSIAKLQMAELNKSIYALAMEFIGADALLYASYAETRPDFASVRGGSGDIRYDYLRSLGNSIEGGTSEILKNILGERVLGLPAEQRPDKGVPWNETRRS